MRGGAVGAGLNYANNTQAELFSLPVSSESLEEAIQPVFLTFISNFIWEKNVQELVKRNS